MLRPCWRRLWHRRQTTGWRIPVRTPQNCQRSRAQLKERRSVSWYCGIEFRLPSWSSRGEFRDELLQISEAPCEFGVRGFQRDDSGCIGVGGLFQFLIQPLDCRQRHTICVYGCDMLVIRADAERCVEILCHRAEVAAAFLVVAIVPSADRQRDDFG